MKEGPGELGQKLVANMPALTQARIGELGYQNALRNQPLLGRGKSLRALRGQFSDKGDHCIVVGAGPSLHRRRVAERLRELRYQGTLIATESAMSYCLRNQLIPDLVVSLDPHAKRIVRWFGDPKLVPEDIAKDDYFSRQDMDPAFADELRSNLQMIELLNQHGKKMRIALATSASEAVVDRVIETGMEIFWWNPMYDDPNAPDSVTAKLQALNRMPCMNAGGNVGSACWMMADAVLGKKHVALTGIDFSYYGDTPYRSTQYYRDAVDLVGEEALDSIFMRVFNPHLEAWFYTDPAYMWYRNCFMEMVGDASCKTYNCTEGGILFGDNITFLPLDKYVQGTRS